MIPKLIPLIVVLALVLPILYWRAKRFHFQCPLCGYSFKVSPWVTFLSPHFFLKRYLACPNCHKRSLMSPEMD